jgi:translation elongation factor EF-1beta
MKQIGFEPKAQNKPIGLGLVKNQIGFEPKAQKKPIGFGLVYI